MSHITTIEFTEEWELDVIKEMCESEELFEFLENVQTYKWYGRHVGDYPVPEGFTVDDMGKCHHVINVKGAEYQIGVVVREERTDLLWDFYSPGGLPQALGKEAGKLKQGYALAKAKRTARRNHHRCREEQKNGYRELRIQMN